MTAAVVVTAPGVVEHREVEIGPLPANAVRIRTLCSGISTGTDRWVITGRFEWGGFGFPLVPGYQRCGVVTAIGADVERFRLGQLVVATGAVGLEGVTPAWGAHLAEAPSAEEDVFDATGLDPEPASLFVSAQVGYNAASRLTLPEGAAVVVVGDGVIGACAALFARDRGYRVLVVGRHVDRLTPLAEAGVEVVAEAAAAEAVQAWAPDGAIDTVQTEESCLLYAPGLPHGRGEVVFCGHTPDGRLTWGDMATMQKRELTARFVSGTDPARIRRTLERMRRGAVRLDALIGRAAWGGTEAAAIMRDVARGRLGATAAIVDWREDA